MIGIIGKTQGVNERNSPNTKKVAKITKKLLDLMVSAMTSVSDFVSFATVVTSFFNSFFRLGTAAVPDEESFELSTASVKVFSIGS